MTTIGWVPTRSHATAALAAFVVAGLLPAGCSDGEDAAQKPPRASQERPKPAPRTTAGREKPRGSEAEERVRDEAPDDVSTPQQRAGSKKKPAKKRKARPPRDKAAQRRLKAAERRRSARKHPDDGQPKDGGRAIPNKRPVSPDSLRRCLRRAKTQTALALCLDLSPRELDRLAYRGCLALAAKARNPGAARDRCLRDLRRRQRSRRG